MTVLALRMLSHCMLAAGLRSVSVMWGAWAAGMAASDAATAQRFQRLGMGIIQPHAGLAALARILATTSETQVQHLFPLGYHIPWTMQVASAAYNSGNLGC